MMTKIKIFRLILTIGFVGAMTACASEEEKVERIENAFDISGSYKTSESAGSKVGLHFDIRNETGRHDIVVDMERLSEYTQTEKNFLTSKGIDVSSVINHFGNTMTLGAGYASLQMDGGENISTDFGESSRFHVCGPKYQYDLLYSLKYCLSGTISKNDKIMKGQLSLNSTKEETKIENGKKVTSFKSDQLELAFTSDVNLVFYKQYLGSWTGDVYQVVSDFSVDNFKYITMSNAQADEVYANLNSSTFEYQGEQYTYLNDLSLMSLEEIKNQDYPAVHMVFKSQTTAKKITVFGQIWSLGEFTGSIIHESGDSYNELATFRLKKI